MSENLGISPLIQPSETPTHFDSLESLWPKDQILNQIIELCDIIARQDRLYQPVPDLLKTSQKFLTLMLSNQFWPSPSILSKAHNSYPVIFDRVALKLSDDFEHIFHTLKTASILLQHQVKVAVDFSELRAHRSQISSGPRQSLGPVKFMESFAEAPQGKPKQKLRFSLSIDHLDVSDYLAYIDTAPEHLNFTLLLTSEFFQALEQDRPFGLRHKQKQEPTRWVKPSTLSAIITALLEKGRPIDFIFSNHLERLKNDHLLPESWLLNPDHQLTSPAELSGYGALNLFAFVKNGHFLWDDFSKAIQTSIHFMDNCFDLNFYPLPEVKIQTLKHRRLNLNLVGLSQTLNALIDSDRPKRQESLAKEILDFAYQKAILTSQKQGQKRGLPHRIFFANQWHKTRHCQLFAFNKMPLWDQLFQWEPVSLLEEKTSASILQNYIPNLVYLPHKQQKSGLNYFIDTIKETYQQRFISCVFEKTTAEHPLIKTA